MPKRLPGFQKQCARDESSKVEQKAPRPASHNGKPALARFKTVSGSLALPSRHAFEPPPLSGMLRIGEVRSGRQNYPASHAACPVFVTRALLSQRSCKREAWAGEGAFLKRRREESGVWISRPPEQSHSGGSITLRSNRKLEQSQSQTRSISNSILPAPSVLASLSLGRRSHCKQRSRSCPERVERSRPVPCSWSAPCRGPSTRPPPRTEAGKPSLQWR